MQRALAQVVVAPQALEDGVAVELVARIGVGVVDAVVLSAAVEVFVLALALGVLEFRIQLGCQAVGIVLGVRHHVEVVLPVGARRQGDHGAGGVARARGQAGGVAVHDRAEGRGAFGDEGWVGAEVDGVEPALGAAPDVRAEVGHRPADGGFLTGEVLGDGADMGDAQIGRAVVHPHRHALDVVAFGHLGDLVGAGKPFVGRVGLHHQVAAADRGAEVDGLRDAVALAIAQRALFIDAAEQPDHTGLVEIGVVGQPDLVGPATVEGIALVLHGVVEGVGPRRSHRRRARHLGDGQVGRGRAQHADGAGLVVVVVDLGRVVRVLVRRQGVFKNRVVGVAPDGHEVLASAHAVRDLHIDRAEVVLADGELAGVRHLADANVALARVGPALVHRQPDAVGPAVDGGQITAGDSRAAVGDLVAHLNRCAVHGLVGRDHVAGDQIGEGDRVNVEARGAGVVCLAGVLVDAVAAVGGDDQVGVTPVADRDVHAVDGGGVGLGRRERGTAGHAGNEDVVAAEDAVQAQVDIVDPLADRGLGAEVADGELQAGGRAGADMARHRDGGDAQIGPVIQADDDGVGVGGRVVVAGRAVFIDLRRAGRAEQAVGDDAQAIGALDLGRQAQLLGAAVAQAGIEAAVIGEAAEHDGAAVRREQQHGVLPLTGGARQALVQDRPTHIDQRAFLGGGGCVDRLDHQVGRVAQGHRHGDGMANVVVGVDELERPAGGHVQEPVARDAVRQAGADAAVVAVTHRHLAEVAGAAQVDPLAAAIGVAAEPDGIAPRAGVGDADAAVGHRPFDGDGPAAVGDRRRADRFDPHVGVGDGQHIGGVGGAADVVGLVVMLPDDAGGIGLHDDGAVAAEGRAEGVVEAAAVAVADGQRAVVDELAEDDVVGIADHVVSGVDDAVGPTASAASAGALVADGPLHRDAGRVVDHAGRRADAQHGQVGVVVAGDAQRQAGLVVGLAQGAFVVGRVGVGDDDQPP